MTTETQHDDEIRRLESAIKHAVMEAFDATELSATVLLYPTGGGFRATVAMSQEMPISGEGTTKLNALRDLGRRIERAIRKRRDDASRALRILGEPIEGTTHG